MLSKCWSYKLLTQPTHCNGVLFVQKRDWNRVDNSVWVNTYRYIFSGLFTSINPSYDLGWTTGVQGFDPSPIGSHEIWALKPTNHHEKHMSKQVTMQSDGRTLLLNHMKSNESTWTHKRKAN